MPHLHSSIPLGAVERLLRQYSEANGGITYRTTECWHDGQLIGERRYSREGRLVIETPLRDGLKHGREYTWDEAGWLELVEPYTHGKLHGTARQYDQYGRVIGTYRCVHGTGYDIWHTVDQDGSARLSEVRSLRDGERHGFEWCLSDDQVVAQESHFWAGKLHGIERRWNATGRLNRGYPRYWIDNQRVTRRQYLRVAAHDATLPRWRDADNSPRRTLPPEVRQQWRHSPATAGYNSKKR